MQQVVKESLPDQREENTMMSKPTRILARGAILMAAMLLSTALVGAAEKQALELASPLVDDLILQRGMEVPVWGWAEPGSVVTVAFAGQSKSATVGEKGKWMVNLDPLKASHDERELTVSTAKSERITRRGVLVGEVWFASGQSNMDWLAGKSMCRDLANELQRAKEDVPIRAPPTARLPWKLGALTRASPNIRSCRRSP
jgi:hypothetical protein